MKDKHEQLLKYLCMFVLGFAIGFGIVPKAYGSPENPERVCLAQNIYFEAGNQPVAGKIAVAQVVLNRVQDGQFPDNVCDVVYQTKQWRTSWKGNKIPALGQCQFSWFCDGKSDEPTDSTTWIESYILAERVLSGDWDDITEGALWYHADYIMPYWAYHLNRTVYINDHIFYK